MENKNSKSFFDSLKEDWEKDLLFSKKENEKKLELQKKEQEEENKKRWEKIENKLKIIYWLIGTSLGVSVVSLVLFLVKSKN